MQERILLLAANPKSRAILPRALQDEAPRLEIEVHGRIHEALTRLADAPFDAAVCCVDTPDELSYVIRIRKRNPDLPVVMLTRVAEAGFDTLAQSMGASAVVRKISGLEATSRSLALAIETRMLAREHRAQFRRTAELAGSVRRLAKLNRKIVEMALGIVANDQGEFATLYVEQDREQSLQLVRALARAKLPPLVRPVNSIEAAKDYLSGRPPYDNRDAFPFPSLVISDLQLPGKSGLDLVDWMRSRPETRLLGAIILTSSTREQDIDEAYRRGANLYLIKRDLSEVVGVVREVFAQYHAQRAGLNTL